MKKLAELSQYVLDWNLLGKHIPKLELIILFSDFTSQIKAQFLNHLFGGHLDQIPLINQNNLLPGHQSSIISSQDYEMDCPTQANIVRCRCHMIQDKSSSTLKDQQYKLKRKTVEKLLKQPSSLLVAFISDQQDKGTSLGMQFLFDFGHQRVIQVGAVAGQWDFEDSCRQIHKKYVQLVRVQIVMAYRDMITLRGMIQEAIEPYKEVCQLRVGQELQYIFRKHRQFVLQISASLSGTFVKSKKSNQGQIKLNLRSQIFERLFNIWDKQYARVQKSIELLPLPEIQHLLKCYDASTLNGFLSADCFKSIFSGYLDEIEEEIRVSISQIYQMLTTGIQQMLEEYFHFIGFRQQFWQSLTIYISQGFQYFRTVFDPFLASQIRYISVSYSEFWKVNAINTSLYANQTLVEVKYMGIGYVKRVVEGLKESIPKLVGELLICRILDDVNRKSFGDIEELIKNGADLLVEEGTKLTLQNNEKKLEKLNALIRYFCLKVDSHNIIPNISQRIQNFINSQMKVSETGEEQQVQQVEEITGFLDRLKKMFGLRKQRHVVKRSASADKNKEQIHSEPAEQQEQNRPAAVRDTEWLIAVSTNKELSRQRMQESAKRGFPKALRASIWLYIANKNELPKVQDLVLQMNKSSIIYKQIMKDVPRTPPANFFKQEPEAKQALQNILVAYSIYDPPVAYTQGMNFIVSLIIRVLIGYQESASSELRKKNYKVIAQHAFTILSYIINQLNWKTMFIDATPRLFQLSLEIDDKIQKYLPKIAEKFESQSYNTSMIFAEGILTIFSAKTNYQFAKRIMDDFLVRGEPAVSNILLKTLQLNQTYILNIKTNNQLFMFLRSELLNHTYKHYNEILTEIISQDYY